MSKEWNIRARGHICRDCEKGFADGEAVFSTLAQGAAGEAGREWERADRCRECHDARRSPGEAFVWQGLYRAPEPERRESTPRERIESLLRGMLEAPEDPDSAGVIYILAVMLERKRVIVERDARPRDDGTTLRLYERRGTGESWLIADPGLELGELEPLRERVARLLEDA